MNATETPDVPEPTLTEVYGRPAVTIPARHKGHTLKSGEVVYKDATETYEWARDGKAIILTKEDGERHTVEPWHCSCKAYEFCKAPKSCKHLDALWRLKMWDAPAPPPMPQILDELREAGGSAWDSIDDVERFLGRSSRKGA